MGLNPGYLLKSFPLYFQKIIVPLCEGGKELTMVWHTPFVLSLAQVKKERLLCSLHKWIPDAGERWSWKVDWQRKLFLGPDLRQNKNPLADLVLVLLVFLVLLFSALAAARVALGRRRRTMLHCRRNQPSILIKEILSFNLLHWQYQHSPGRRNWRGCRWGIRTPPDFGSCTSKTFSFKRHCLLFPPSDS